MTRSAGPAVGSVAAGSLCVLSASVLWGTTGTAATFAPAVGPLAIGAAAMGLGGLLQALVAAPRIARERSALRARRGVVALGALAVGAYPLAFYSSMHLAGVAAGTVVSIGSAPLASALIERVVDKRRLTRRWMTGAALGLSGTVLLCVAEAAEAHSGPGVHSVRTTVLGVGLGLVAGLTYALYSWAAHRLISRGVTSGAAMGAVFGLGGLLLLPVLVATGAPLLGSWSNAAVGSYMALVPMFTGYVLFGWGLAHVPASTATTLSLLEPAVAAVLAVLVVGERLPPLGWTGVALVVGCLAVLTAPTRSAPSTRTAPSTRAASPTRAVPPTRIAPPASAAPPTGTTPPTGTAAPARAAPPPMPTPTAMPTAPASAPNDVS
ncbi:DMT family transporter [Streptomyces sp. NPDC002962]|uniref:DMT family transporter n=1 Tax=Streptomyces sp. NPDC002962 TaxID=3364674 RepID=UPI003678B24C